MAEEKWLSKDQCRCNYVTTGLYMEMRIQNRKLSVKYQMSSLDDLLRRV